MCRLSNCHDAHIMRYVVCVCASIFLPYPFLNPGGATSYSIYFGTYLYGTSLSLESCVRLSQKPSRLPVIKLRLAEIHQIILPYHINPSMCVSVVSTSNGVS